MDRVILHCDMNNFFASVECRNDPSLRGLPVAVCGRIEDRHGIVLAKNYEAKKYGIQTGEPVIRAKARCPSLVIVDPHYEEYVKFSRLAKKIYCEYTDMVEPFGDDECWLDVTGSRALFGDGQTIANIIRERIKNELGLTVSVGVSFNKVFAKLGSDMKKPDAVTVINRCDFREKIWHLPASEMIGVGRATEAVLSCYGIHTIGQLANAYPPLIAGRLGINGVRLQEAANGRDTSRVLKFEERIPIKSVGRGTTPSRDLVYKDDIKHLMVALCEDIGHRLILFGKKASGVSISLRDVNLTTRQYQKKLSFSTDSASVIAHEAFLLMKEKHKSNTPLRSVTVTAIDLSDASDPRQIDFFADVSDTLKRERLDKTVDDINNRYGFGTVCYAGGVLSGLKGSAFGFGATHRVDTFVNLR
jgi:DNA polymerase-4